MTTVAEPRTTRPSRFADLTASRNRPLMTAERAEAQARAIAKMDAAPDTSKNGAARCGISLSRVETIGHAVRRGVLENA